MKVTASSSTVTRHTRTSTHLTTSRTSWMYCDRTTQTRNGSSLMTPARATPSVSLTMQSLVRLRDSY